MMTRKQLAHSVVEQLASLPEAKRKAFIKRLAAYLIVTKQAANIDLFLRDIAFELQASGVLETRVVSAKPLSEKIKSELRQLLVGITGVEHVRFSEEIDEWLIGGLVARTPELELDVSVRHKLLSLRG